MAMRYKLPEKDVGQKTEGEVNLSPSDALLGRGVEGGGLKEVSP